jgi:dihydrolipoamide dehydrogenase
MADHFDVVVVGAGVGGYPAAIRAAQLGKKVAIVDKATRLGGTCLNVGCIPSKALLESSELYHDARHAFGEHGVLVGELGFDLAKMLARKEGIVAQLTDGIAGLMKKNRVKVIRGTARFLATRRLAVTTDEGEREIEADAVVVATGSVPVELPFLRFDGTHVVSSTEALAFERVPEHLVVVGAGAVGLELGSVWLRLGAQVTVLELLPQIVPFADGQLARGLQRALKQQGMDIRLKTKVTGAEVAHGRVTVRCEAEKGGADTIGCDRVLVAVGRRPYTTGLGLEAAGITLDERGRIPVDEHLRTAAEGVWAVGDVVAGPMLAHKAEEEGIAAAELLAGQPGHVNPATIPSVVYTDPELAGVGLTEEQAKAEKRAVRIGRALFRANGRALGLGKVEGMVKLIADAKTDRLLGAHVLGPRASELIAEAVLALEYHASAEDLARTIHAHPTLSEVLKEAALDVDGRAIHA